MDPLGIPGKLGFCPIRRIGPQYPLLIVKGDKKGQKKKVKSFTLRQSGKHRLGAG